MILIPVAMYSRLHMYRVDITQWTSSHGGKTGPMEDDYGSPSEQPPVYVELGDCRVGVGVRDGVRVHVACSMSICFSFLCC